MPFPISVHSRPFAVPEHVLPPTVESASGFMTYRGPNSSSADVMQSDGYCDETNREHPCGERKVMFQGAPLDQGSIDFTPQAPKERIGSGAVIRAGEYSIDRDKGLPPGTYLVQIHSGKAAEPKPDEAPAAECPQRGAAPGQVQLAERVNDRSKGRHGKRV